MKLLRWLPQLSLRWRESPIDRRLKRESEEWAFRLARKSDDRTMGPTLEHTVIQLFDSLEQRVTALEKNNRWHRTAAELLMNLEPRLAEVENVMNQIHKLNPPLPLATLSPPTASPTTDSPSDAVQETTGVWTPQSWQLDPRITPGGPVGFGSEFVDPEDAWT